MASTRRRRLLAAAVAVGGTGLVGWAAAVGPDRPPTAVPAAVTLPGSEPAPTPTARQPRPPDLGAAPDLIQISGWLNTDATSLEELRAEVTIVQFWTFGCVNCKATLPHLRELYAAYSSQGLEIVGVHAHEFAHERDPVNIAAAVADLGVTWPVALDSDKVNFRNWQGSPRFWPRIYVIDRDGRIRFDHIGEGAYDELEGVVQALLQESGSG